MNIAGSDYSTQAVDIVTVPYDQPGTPDWHRYPLQGDGAFERARDVANELPGRSSMFWDDILAVGIEHPGGRYGTGAMLRVQGAILSVIPARMLVISLPPGRWRKLNGLPGGASKDGVADQSLDLLLLAGVISSGPLGWPRYWQPGLPGPPVFCVQRRVFSLASARPLLLR